MLLNFNNYLQLFAQMGSEYSPTEAVELTPDSWTFNDENDEDKFTAGHNFKEGKSFSWVRTDVSNAMLESLKIRTQSGLVVLYSCVC